MRTLPAPLACMVALTTLIAGAVPHATADFPPGPSASDDGIEHDLAAALATQPNVRVDTSSIPEGGVSIDRGIVRAPTGDPSQPVTLELRDAALTDVGLSAASDTDGVGMAVTDEGDGAFRVLFHIASADDLAQRFEIDDAFELLPLEDGGIAVRNSDGDLVGTIAPPWAVDADGTPVPTDFAIHDDAVVQRIYPSASTAFPVVSDPFWIPALMVMGQLTRHAITQAAARGVSHALIRQVVQNGSKSAGQRGTSVFSQGNGGNRIRVIVDNRTGNIITVTKG